MTASRGGSRFEERRRTTLRSLIISSEAGGACKTETDSTKPDSCFKGPPAARKATVDNAQRMSATLEPDAASGTNTLESLKSLVHGYIDLARRSPACAALLFCDREADQDAVERGPQVPRPLQTIARHVRAAQQSGRLTSGDPEQLAVIIVGAIVGASDLAQNGWVSAACGGVDLPSLPLFLIDRFALDCRN